MGRFYDRQDTKENQPTLRFNRYDDEPGVESKNEDIQSPKSKNSSSAAVMEHEHREKKKRENEISARCENRGGQGEGASKSVYTCMFYDENVFTLFTFLPQLPQLSERTYGYIGLGKAGADYIAQSYHSLMVTACRHV